MGTYMYASGHVQYKTKKAYDKVVDALIKYQFISPDRPNETQSDGDWELYEEQAILNPRDFIIFIPMRMYRNFYYIEEILLSQKPKDINLIWTCTDGCTEGGYYKDNKPICKQFEEINPNVPDSEKDEQAYYEWEHECEEYFDQFLRETPEYVPNSVDFFTKEEPCKKRKRKKSKS